MNRTFLQQPRHVPVRARLALAAAAFCAGLPLVAAADAGAPVAPALQLGSSSLDIGLARNAGGASVVAWVQHDDSSGKDSLYVQRIANDGTATGSPILVEGPIATTSAKPAFGDNGTTVAMDGAGDFVVAWSEFVGLDSWHVYAQRFSATDEAGPRIDVAHGIALIGTSNNGFSTTVDAAPLSFLSSDGKPTVSWQRGSSILVTLSSAPPVTLGFDNDTNYLRSFAADGTAATKTTRLPANISFGAAMDGKGNVIIAYAGPTLSKGVWKSDSAIYMRRYAPDGTLLGRPQTVRLSAPFDAVYDVPSVAANADGQSVVAWPTAASGTQPATTVAYQRFDSSGAPVGDVMQFQPAGFDSLQLPQQIPIAMDGTGRFVVSWQQQGYDAAAAEPTRQLDAQYFSADGSPLGNALALPLSAGGSDTSDYEAYGSFYRVHTAVDASGNLAVTWEDDHNGVGGVYGGGVHGVYVKLFSGPN
jgi:hypothetical protein